MIPLVDQPLKIVHVLKLLQSNPRQAVEVPLKRKQHVNLLSLKLVQALQLLHEIEKCPLLAVHRLWMVFHFPIALQALLHPWFNRSVLVRFDHPIKLFLLNSVELGGHRRKPGQELELLLHLDVEGLAGFFDLLQLLK